MLALTICIPEFLATNAFLSDFIGHEVLGILALIATVTIASAANIHLAFNRLEEKADKLGAFASARKEVNDSAIALVYLFLMTVGMLIVRAISEDVYWVSFWNGASLIILLVNMFVLIDLTLAIFELTPFQGGSVE